MTGIFHKLLPAGYATEGQERLLFQRLFWGAVCGCLAAVFLGESPILQSLEYEMLEWQYRVSAELHTLNSHPQVSRDLAIVAYDDQSQFDFWAARFNDQDAQDKLAEVINVIEKGEPALVAIDLDLKGARSEKLVDTMRANQNVALALFGNLREGADLPHPDYLNHAPHGSSQFVKEPNGAVCRLPEEPDEHTATSPDTVPVRPFIEVVARRYCEANGLNFSDSLMAHNSNDPRYINFRKMDYPTVSVRDVVSPGFDPARQFRGKVVLIGAIFSPRSGDDPRYLRTPLDPSEPELKLQADSLQTLIDGNAIATFPRQLGRYLLLCFAAAVGAFCSILPLGLRTAMTLCLAMSLLVVAQLAFQAFHISIAIVPALAVLCTGFVVGTVIWLDTDLRVRNRELAEARETMQLRAEEERKRIAADLHDEVLPNFRTMGRITDKLLKEIGGENPLPKEMRKHLDLTAEEMRRVINDLHPSMLETMGFFAALDNLVSIARQDNQDLDGRFVNESGCQDIDLPEFIELQLYRIAQEGFNNIRKHSGATRADLTVTMPDGSLVICVADNGRGIDLHQMRPDSRGLLNIRQRAQLIGADVEWRIPEQFSSGTELRLKIKIADGLHKGVADDGFNS